MNRQLHNKLRSQSGASITYALLLFLVCTVVGSIVLAAGTAAAGRIGELAQMDQRFYSVNSAAELLEQELSGQKVVVERVKTEQKTVITTYTGSVTQDGGTTATSSSETPTPPAPTYATTVKAMVKTQAGTGEELQTIDPSTMSFLTARVVELVCGDNVLDSEAAWNHSLTGGQSGEETAFKLSCTGANMSYLDVEGTCSIGSDGTMVFLISSVNSKGNDKYTLRLTLNPNVLETENSTMETESTGPVWGNGVYTATETTTTTTTKTSEITWTVASLEKVVAAPAQNNTPGGGGSGG